MAIVDFWVTCQMRETVNATKINALILSQTVVFENVRGYTQEILLKQDDSRLSWQDTTRCHSG